MRAVRAGQLDKVVTIEAVTETQNARGEPVPSWAAEATVWARIEPLRGQELVTAQQRAANVTHKITMRYRDERGTATGAQTSTTLQDTTKTWTPNGFASQEITITGGTGAGQSRTVRTNTGTTLTIDPALPWAVTPDGTSTYLVHWLTMKKRINYRGRIFNMQALLNLEEANRAFEILAVEVTD